jgi:hypothetical protein
MSESINALLNAGHVPTVPVGGQVQFNPLAAINAGNQAAQAEFQTRGLQAQQAIGQILQQATDENGNVDFQKAHRMAASAGPMVQMGMMKFAQDASALKGAQIEQASASHTFVSRLAASGVEDSSDANWANIRAQAVNANAPPQVIAEIDRIRALPEDQRSGVAMQHLKNNLAALDSLQQIQGKRQTVTTPGGTYSYTEPPPGRGTVFTPNGPAPGDVQEGGSWVDAEGKPTQQGAPGAVWQPSVTPKTNMPQFPQGGPPVVTPEGGGGAGGGRQFPAPPPFILNGQQPPAPAAQEAAPPASGPGSVGNTPGRGNYIRPKFDPQTGERLPDGLGLPSPSRPGGVPDSPATHQALPPKPTATQPGNASIPTAPPQGQPATLAANQDEYRKDLANVQPTMTRAENIGKAYQALRLLKEMNSSTGVGAAGWQAFRSRMGTLGLLPDQSMSVQKQQEEFAKYTERLMLDAAGGASTNMGKEMAAKSNPGDIIGMAANFDFLRNDLGKTLQTIYAQQSHEDKAGGGYLSHKGDVALKTDHRGFVWNTYDQEEQAAMMKEAESRGKEAVARLKRAFGARHQLDLSVPGAGQPPPPDKRSMLTLPPSPQPNALAMAG